MDKQQGDIAQWSKEARKRSRKAILDMVRRSRHNRGMLFDSDNRLERAGEARRLTDLALHGGDDEDPRVLQPGSSSRSARHRRRPARRQRRPLS